MKIIILDTNFLVYSAKYKIDIERECERLLDEGFELIVSLPVITELKVLQKEAELKDREAAALALELVKRFKIVKTGAKRADDACLELALFPSSESLGYTARGREHGAGRAEVEKVLATMDKALRKRFKKGKKGRFLVIKQKKYLALI
ncbi:MAG TPA: hypothetical protein HA282_05205 [Nanoarchaeota archaeon]|nr:hypothetical protein [Candidatus Pacearchaeota archaeon]HIH33761.1 hypothetical protein [Nanoarchaeota archaeon]HIH51270.1 hypothetical protein [Nanoarchaeota archaeon]HIH66580.1 hypothetical protein [Nanoarchaeota archaeon]